MSDPKNLAKEWLEGDRARVIIQAVLVFGDELRWHREKRKAIGSPITEAFATEAFKRRAWASGFTLTVIEEWLNERFPEEDDRPSAVKVFEAAKSIARETRGK